MGVAVLGAGTARFICGKRQVLDELIATTASARHEVAIDLFRLDQQQAKALGHSIRTGVNARVVVSNTRQARKETAGLLRRLGDHARTTWYGRSAPGRRDMFNHVKSAGADGNRFTVSTSAWSAEQADRLDWGLTVTGKPARAAQRASKAMRSGSARKIRVELAKADRAQLHYNDPATGALHATDAWRAAIRSARPGDDFWQVTKEITSAKAARELIAASDAGVGVLLIAGRSSGKVRALMRRSNVDFRVNPWPEVSLHGNLTVTNDQVLIGSMYLGKRPLGQSAKHASRELLVSSRDPAVIADAREAISHIPSRPVD